MARRRLQRSGALRDLSPRKIATQILLLQTAYYFVASVLITFVTLVAGQDWSLGLIFDWTPVRGDTTTGWTLALCWMLASLIGVVLLLVLINRSKLIPDFACTIHFINLIIASLYSGTLPRYQLWWLLQIGSCIMMTFLGIWACQRRELAPISFGGGGNKGTMERPKDTPTLPTIREEAGFGGGDISVQRGGLLGWVKSLAAGASSTTDGRGNYEMANMNGHA